MTLMEATRSSAPNSYSTRWALVSLLCLVALSFVLQSRTTAAVSIAFGWSTTLACVDDGRSRDHERGSDDCCLVCGACVLGSAFPLAPSVDLAFAPPQSTPTAFPAQRRISPPIGWESAWSSRAPPFLS